MTARNETRKKTDSKKYIKTNTKQHHTIVTHCCFSAILADFEI